MRTIYRTQFGLAPNPGKKIEYDEVIDLCVKWVLSRGGVAVPQGIDLSGKEHSQLAVGDQRRIETRVAVGDHGQAWGIRLRMPDEEPNVEWVTDTVVHQQSSGDIHFSCNLQVGRTDEALSPVFRSANCPGIVQDILAAYNGKGMIPFNSKPVKLESHMLDLFVKLLESPDRKHPVIFVSTDPHGEVAADVQSLAKHLAGIAYVIVAKDADVSTRLGRYLSDRINCFNAGVRLYWPGFKRSSNPLHHPLWIRTVIQRMTSRNRKFLDYEILERIAAVSSFNTPQSIVSWNRLVDWQRAEAIKIAKDGNKQDELIALFEEDNRSLQNDVNQLGTEMKEKETEINRLRSQVNTLRAALSEKGGEEAGKALEQSIGTVAEALDLADSQFSDSLAFLWNSKSEDVNSPFADPTSVFLAMKWLATDYRAAKLGVTSCSDFDISLRGTVIGWNYKPHQSKNTMKHRVYRAWYHTKIEGKEIALPEHIGCASDTDPRNCIRIAFAWDEQSEKVVLGFLGQHQQTSAS